jgi:hypothetical protein
MSDGTRELAGMSVRELCEAYASATDPPYEFTEPFVVELERRIQAAWHAGHAAGLAQAAKRIPDVPIPFKNQEQFDAALSHARNILTAIRALSPEPPKGEE